MKRNMGNLDRLLRALLALVVFGLYAANIISGTVALVLGVLAIVFLATSLISFCPLYAPFGISTCAVKKHLSN